MPRRARLIIPGCPAHLVHRAVNRGDCFLRTADFRTYWKLLAEAAGATDVRIHAYALMSNHVHVLATSPSGEGTRDMMKRVAESYAMAFNRANARTGHLWEGRYRSSIVQTESYFLACHRYIEMNPVRAGIVSRPGDYLWSSYRANAEGEPDLVVPHEEYMALGMNWDGRRRAYREIFGAPEDPHRLAQIRAAARGGYALGGEDFTTQVERATGHAAVPRARGRPAKQGDEQRRK
jgi:putative transposase